MGIFSDPLWTGNPESGKGETVLKNYREKLHTLQNWTGIVGASFVSTATLGMLTATALYLPDLTISQQRNAEDITSIFGANHALFYGSALVLLLVYSLPASVECVGKKKAGDTLGGQADSLFHPGAAFFFWMLMMLFIGLSLLYVDRFEGFFGFMASAAACAGLVQWITFGAVFTLRARLPNPDHKTIAVVLQVLVPSLYNTVQPFLLELMESNFSNSGRLWSTQIPVHLFFLGAFSFFGLCLVTMATLNVIEHDRDLVSSTKAVDMEKTPSSSEKTRKIWMFNLIMFTCILAAQISDYTPHLGMRPYQINATAYNNSALNTASFSGMDMDRYGFWSNWGATIGIVCTTWYLLFPVWIARWWYGNEWKDEAGFTNRLNNFGLLLTLTGSTIVLSIWASGYYSTYNQFMAVAASYGGFSAGTWLMFCFVACYVQMTREKTSKALQNKRDFLAIVALATARGFGFMTGMLVHKYSYSLSSLQTPLITSASLAGGAMVILMFSWGYKGMTREDDDLKIYSGTKKLITRVFGNRPSVKTPFGYNDRASSASVVST
jgi:hypothetical protein